MYSNRVHGIGEKDEEDEEVRLAPATNYLAPTAQKKFAKTHGEALRGSSGAYGVTCIVAYRRRRGSFADAKTVVVTSYPERCAVRLFRTVICAPERALSRRQAW